MLFPPLLFLLGALLGALTNWFVDRFAWIPRFRSPWRVWPHEFSERLNAAASRKRSDSKEPFAKRWPDFLPLVGWIFLSRLGEPLERLPAEQRLPGLETRRFWIRPFLVELLCGFGFVALYFWEVQGTMLLPNGLEPELFGVVFQRYWIHLLLFVLLLAATLIDFDDMVIPDLLTVAGTVLALSLAAFFPQLSLPATQFRVEVVYRPHPNAQRAEDNFDLVYTQEKRAVPLNYLSPNPPAALPRMPLAMAGLWVFWCLAMLDRVWYGRRLGFRRSWAIFLRHLVRSPRTKYWLGAMIVGPVAIGFLFNTFKLWESAHAVGLFSALVGMAVGMTLVWSVRLVAGGALGREAMGFGDVTLMGMIGAFLGWQACIPIFFLAPILGVVHGILNALFGRGREFPYGPWLCLATVLVVVAWPTVWGQLAPVYELGWILGAVLLVCLALMGVMLLVWRHIRERLFAGPDQ